MHLTWLNVNVYGWWGKPKYQKKTNPDNREKHANLQNWKLENCSMVKWYWTIFTRLTDISIYMANVNQKVYIEILRFWNRQNLKNCTLETYVICQKVHNVGIWNSGGKIDFKYWNLCVFQNRISSVSQTEINLILKINIKHTNLF